MSTPPIPTHPSWSEAVASLESVVDDWPTRDVVGIADLLADAKAMELAQSDEDRAKTVWCYEQALSIQQHFIRAFLLMRSGEFYEGWCALERAEVEHGFLLRHITWLPTETHVAFIAAAVARFQSLYPYEWFMSPEIREKSKSCSICGAKVRIRNPCGHRVGEVYGGQMCVRIVNEVEFLGSAMVKSPVQKYSVPFLVDAETGESRDHYDYSVVEFAIRHLQSPFDPWSVEDTLKLHPHKVFKHIGRNAKCPCGSDRRYKGCCLKKAGVELPHKHFTFPKLEAQAGKNGLLGEEVTFSRALSRRLKR